jgi:hypothetical protein
MDPKDAEIARLNALVASMSVTGATGAAPTHAFVPKYKSPPKVAKVAEETGGGPKEKRTVKHTYSINWALVRPGLPVRIVSKDLKWSGVFMSPTCWRLTAINGKECAPPIEYGSINIFAKAHQTVRMRAGAIKKDTANAWVTVEFESDTHSWVKFDSIRKKELKTPTQVSVCALTAIAAKQSITNPSPQGLPVAAEASASAAPMASAAAAAPVASAALDEELDEGAEKPMSQESAPDDIEPDFEMEDITYNEQHFQRKVGTDEIYLADDNKTLAGILEDGKMTWDWEHLPHKKSEFFYKNVRNDVIVLQEGTAKWVGTWNAASKTIPDTPMPPDIDLVAVAEQLNAMT